MLRKWWQVLIEKPLLTFPSVKHVIVRDGVVQQQVVQRWASMEIPLKVKTRVTWKGFESIRCQQILKEIGGDVLEKVLSLYCPSTLDHEVSF